MIVTNFFQFVGITALSGVTFLLAPYWLYDMRRRAGDVLEKTMLTVALSAIQMIMNIYLLAFLHVLSFLSLWGLLLGEALLIWSITRGQPFWRKAPAVYGFIMHVHDGHYKLSVILRDRLRAVLRRLARWAAGTLWPNLPYVLCFTAALGFSLVVLGGPVLNRMSFGVSDLYVYIPWVKGVLNNQIFIKGVYTYGLHNIVAALSLMYQIDPVTLLRLFGLCYNLFGLLVLLWVFRAVFENRWTAMFAVCLHSFINLFTFASAYFRSSYTLTQELSQLFCFIAAGFYVRFLKAPDKRSLWRFAPALCASALAHMYPLVVLVLFCGSYSLVYARMLLRDRARLARRVLMVVGAAFGAALFWPIVGLLTGVPLEQSFLWGLGVLNKTTPETAIVPAADFLARVQQMTQLPFVFHLERIVPVLLTGGLGIYCVLRNKNRAYGKRLLGISLYQLMMHVLLLSGPLGLPTIMDSNRTLVFMSVTACAFYVAPADLLFLLDGARRRMAAAGAYIVLMGGFLFYRYGTRYLYYSALSQTSGAVTAYYQIKREREIGVWTIVSSVDESAMSAGYGWHYEMYQFVLEMDPYKPDIVIEIPTPYVYFYVEKIPVDRYAFTAVNGKDFAPLYELDAQTPAPALASLSAAQKGELYNDYASRRMLMGKLSKWAEAFMRQFPDDMRVYYEDDELIVYEYRQNMFHYTNFSMDYGYNPYVPPVPPERMEGVESE